MAELSGEESTLIEILDNQDNEEDENIEYAEYSDEDDMKGYVVVEADCDDLDYDVESTHETNVESKPSEDTTNEYMYHCNTCDMNFHSVEDHLAEYHRNQSVLFDGVETNADNMCTNADQLEDSLNSQQNEHEDTDEIEGAEVFMIQELLDDGETTEDIYRSGRIEIKTEKPDCDFDENDIEQNIVYSDGSTCKKISNSSPRAKLCWDQSGEIYLNKKIKIEDYGSPSSPKKMPKGGKNAYVKTEYDDHEIKEIEKVIYVCPMCHVKFTDEHKLTIHMAKHSDVKALRVAKVKRKPPAEQVVCDICNTTFPSNKSYRLHARMHGPVKVRPIEEAIGYELKSLAKDGKLPSVTFFCEICSKSYDISFQEIHMKSHKAGTNYVCTLCNKKFANEISLDMHLKAHQENPKVKPPTKAELAGTTLPYECGYCGRQFARPHEKVKHERIHTGEKPYKCEICGKSFRVAYCLTLHLRTHTAARPYVCPHCNKRFKAYSGYNHHLMTHSDNRPYKCPHCPKAFKTAVQLAGHKNSHTKPFSCPECNRPFASLYAVKAHMETHKRYSQSLKHRCPVCGAIYARVFALKDHMKEQHQTNFLDGDDVVEINIADVPLLNENETSAQSILQDNGEEITIGEMDNFQTEEVVTDWLK